MMPRGEFLKDVIADLRMAASFVTILPVASSKPAGDGAVARATWALPIAGLLVGLAGAFVYKIASRFGLTPNLAALLALATTTLITGALHEDGLADTADGLGGGRTRERKLEIMRDSRIGTYGVCALVLSFVLRIGALASLRDPTLVFAALIAAHAAARAGLPAFMRWVQPARTDGLSAHAGIPPGTSVSAAIAFGIVALGGGFGFAAGLIALVALACLHGAMAWLCRQQIQGQTGDVLGALEQIGEIAVLLVAAAVAQS